MRFQNPSTTHVGPPGAQHLPVQVEPTDQMYTNRHEHSSRQAGGKIKATCEARMARWQAREQEHRLAAMQKHRRLPVGTSACIRCGGTGVQVEVRYNDDKDRFRTGFITDCECNTT